MVLWDNLSLRSQNLILIFFCTPILKFIFFCSWICWCDYRRLPTTVATKSRSRIVPVWIQTSPKTVQPVQNNPKSVLNSRTKKTKSVLQIKSFKQNQRLLKSGLKPMKACAVNHLSCATKWVCLRSEYIIKRNLVQRHNRF